MLVLFATAYILLVYFRPLLSRLTDGALLEHLNTVVLALGAISAAFSVTSRSASAWSRRVCFLVVCLLAVTASAIGMESGYAGVATAFRVVTSTWLTYVLFAAGARTDDGFRILYWALVICAGLNSAVAIWGAFSGQMLFGATRVEVGVGAFGFDPTTGRSGGIVGENYSGVYNVPVFAAGLCLVTTGRSLRRIFGIGLLLIGIVSIAVGLSRGSTLALTVVAVTYPVMVAQKRRALRIGVLAALLILFVPIAAGWGMAYIRTLPQAVQPTVLSRWTQFSLETDSRIQIWVEYLQSLDNVLLGNGPGYIQSKVASGGMVPHNSLLDVLVEYGILGLALYLAVLVTVFTCGGAVKGRPELAVLYACFCGSLASLLTLSSPFARPLWIAAGLLTGHVTTSIRKRKTLVLVFGPRTYVTSSAPCPSLKN